MQESGDNELGNYLKYGAWLFWDETKSCTMGLFWVIQTQKNPLKFYLYIVGGLLKWTGSWLKGQGSHQDVRAAIAWSQIPVIIFFIVEMIVFFAIGGSLNNPIYATIFFVFSLWAAIIFLCCLAEAHKFSFVKALLNYIITAVIILAIAIIITLVVTAFSPGDTAQTTGQN